MRWLRKIRYWRKYKRLKSYIESFGISVEPRWHWDGIRINLDDEWRWLGWSTAIQAFNAWMSNNIPDGCLEFCLAYPSTLQRFMRWRQGASVLDEYSDLLEISYCGIRKIMSASNDWDQYFDGCERECQENIDRIMDAVECGIHVEYNPHRGGCKILVYSHKSEFCPKNADYFYGTIVDEWDPGSLSCVVEKVKNAVERRKKECIVHHASEENDNQGTLVSPAFRSDGIQSMVKHPVQTVSLTGDLETWTSRSGLTASFNKNDSAHLKLAEYGKATSLMDYIDRACIAALINRLKRLSGDHSTATSKLCACAVAEPTDKAIILASLTTSEVVRCDGKKLMSILRSIPEDIQTEFGLLTGMPGVSVEEAMNTAWTSDGEKIKFKNGSSVAIKSHRKDEGSKLRGLTTDYFMIDGGDSHFDLPALRPKSEWETTKGYKSPKATAYVLDESTDALDAAKYMAMSMMAAKEHTSSGMMALPRTPATPNPFKDLRAQQKRVDLREKYKCAYEYYNDKRLARWIGILSEALVGHQCSSYRIGDQIVIESRWDDIVKTGHYGLENDWSLDLLKSAFCSAWIGDGYCHPEDHLNEVEELWNSIDENGCSKRGRDWVADEKFTISLPKDALSRPTNMPHEPIEPKVELGTPQKFWKEFCLDAILSELAEKSNKLFFDSIMGVRPPSVEEVKRAIADIQSCYRRPTPVLRMKPAQWMDIALSLVKDQNDCSNWSANKVREITEKFEPKPRKKDRYV